MKNISTKFQTLLVTIRDKKQFASGMLAQISTSAANFIFTAILIKNMSPAEFGVFSIVFSLAFFIGGATSATTATQMAVHVGEIHAANKSEFISNMLWKHNKISILTGAALIALSYILDETFSDIKITTKIAACCLTAFSYSYRDFILKVLYEEKKEVSLLYLSITSSILLLSIIGLFFELKVFINTEIALLIYSAANIFPTLFWQTKLKLSSLKYNKTNNEIITWKNSLHNLIAHTLSNLRSQGYIYITGLILGSPAVAALNAARIMAMPAFVIVPAITQRILPPLSKSISSENTKETLKIKKKAIISIVWIGLSISAIMLLLYPLIDGVIYSKYEKNLSYISMWFIIALASGIRAVHETALVAGRQFSLQSRLNLNSLIILTILSTVLSLLLGPTGALISLIASEASFIIQIKILSNIKQR